MANSILTPLQLTAVASLLQNQGIKTVPSALTVAINAFNATTLIADFLAALSFYQSSSFKTQSTLNLLLEIGNTVCPALGNSIPASPIGNYPYLTQEYILPATPDLSTINPSGFSYLVDQTASAYLGNGDSGQFAQGFQAVEGYILTTNQYINTAVNANNYLGPAFTNMNDLTTNYITAVNTDITNFGIDLAKQGNLWDPKNITLYGTPVGLLQQIAKQAKINAGTMPVISSRLIAAGMSTADISNLVTNNQFGFRNPNGLTDNQFNTLQKIAYEAIADVNGADLQQILQLLDVTTPNISTLADLLNP